MFQHIAEGSGLLAVRDLLHVLELHRVLPDGKAVLSILFDLDLAVLFVDLPEAGPAGHDAPFGDLLRLLPVGCNELHLLPVPAADVLHMAGDIVRPVRIHLDDLIRNIKVSS